MVGGIPVAPHEVVLFLELVRRARAARRLSFRHERKKNERTLFELGWLPRDMFECVAALQPEQALGIPRPNSHPRHPEELTCEFGALIEGRDVYVKVTVAGIQRGPVGCVVSFHFAEKPFKFPFAD